MNKKIRRAPISSIKTLKIRTFFNKLLPLSRVLLLKFSLIICCCLIHPPALEKRAKRVAKAIIFIPPSCIKAIIIMCPFSEKAVAVSITVSPVTQEALIDVNKASKKLIELLLLAASASLIKSFRRI